MKKIFIEFLANFLSKKNRPIAQARLLMSVEQHSDILTSFDKERLIARSLDFASSYSKVWFWKRSTLIAQALREDFSIKG